MESCGSNVSRRDWRRFLVPLSIFFIMLGSLVIVGGDLVRIEVARVPEHSHDPGFGARGGLDNLCAVLEPDAAQLREVLSATEMGVFQGECLRAA